MSPFYFSSFLILLDLSFILYRIQTRSPLLGSREETRNVPRSDCSSGCDPKCLDNNFYTKSHHLSLTETQLSEATDGSPSLFPHAFSIFIFVLKLDVASM
ncbi:hypothetical protein E2C01_038297 [Portunus trituberculatus]|uniref:Uncharacterized protein n=1 Tax=Portunus trituberculatus TaxID=210409 RepID=A0A5B7FAH9_PORTR|nr:hypothetical protein [Portunus trituberculatus]